jgi:N-acetylated-alpha-linked acidic dipeptidase
MFRSNLLLTVFLLFSNTVFGQTITGFTFQSSEAERELEEKFLALPRPENTERYLFKLTEEPHIAGSPESKAVAEYINSKYLEWGLDSKLVEYQVYLPYPKSVQVKMVAPDTVTLNLVEDSWRFDKDSYDSHAVTAFNAYSPSGDVTAQVVYVNRGLPDDYEALAELGVEVRGRIALARYGGSFRGVKAQVAEEHGAAGLIIYSDPADDGYMRGDIYPNGPMRPENAIQRGSLLYIFNYPGDPLTPGFASAKNAKGLKPAEAGSITKTPTTPISYSQANLILKNLAGPEVPDGWQGGLPFRYHVGPGPATIHMKLEMDYQIRPIYNVIAEIKGSAEPDKLVVIGNHHDAWVHGAVDPSSGTAAVMEIGRGFGELLKSGWRPKRTIILAHWDAEEYGLIGSTEWVEEKKAELAKNAALYINIDSAVSGENFDAGAVPSLDRFIQEVVREIPDPKTQQTVFQRWWVNQNKKEYKRLKQTIPDTAETKIDRLGSGSDYTAFLQHVGVPSVSMGFGGRYGVYHSILDNFYWMKNWGDPTFEYHAAMAKIGGLMALRFAQADVYPFNYADYADAIVKHFDELEKSLKGKFLKVEIDFTTAKEKAREWKAACDSLNMKTKSALEYGNVSPEMNNALMQMERQLLGASGLPGRDWFKHRVYAPGSYTGYAAKPLPGISEPADNQDWDGAKRELSVLIEVLDQVIATARKAAL